MSTINIDRECGCFRKSNLENNTSFESKDDALMQAQAMLIHMNSKFCKKHAFSLSEVGEDFNITMGQPVQQATSAGCCGGGHCS